MKKRILALCLLIAAPAAAEDDSQSKFTVTIGGAPQSFLDCYANAQSGDVSPAAIAPCDRSLEKESLTERQKAVVYVNRGVIRFNIGDYSAAVADFTDALDLRIFARARTYVNRGLSFEAMGRDRRARADYEAALEINSNHPIATRRLQELDKPLYERSKPPRRITVENAASAAVGI